MLIHSGLHRNEFGLEPGFLYLALAIPPATFASGMVTYYCHSIEEALRRAKIAGRRAGCYMGGIVLPSGKRGFAVYRDGKEVERYSVIGR